MFNHMYWSWEIAVGEGRSLVRLEGVLFLEATFILKIIHNILTNGIHRRLYHNFYGWYFWHTTYTELNTTPTSNPDQWPTEHRTFRRLFLSSYTFRYSATRKTTSLTAFLSHGPTEINYSGHNILTNRRSDGFGDPRTLPSLGTSVSDDKLDSLINHKNWRTVHATVFIYNKHQSS